MNDEREDNQPDIRIQIIGNIDKGIDGIDQYVLLKCIDDDLDADTAHDWLLRRYYHDSTQPGRYFCKSVSIVPIPHASNGCIGIIHHRYDV